MLVLLAVVELVINREQQKNKSVWTREQEEELACLYEQYKDENGNFRILVHLTLFDLFKTLLDVY